MITEQKIAEEVTAVQLPETKVLVLGNGTMNGSFVWPSMRAHRNGAVRRRIEMLQVILRVLCMASCLLALSLMVAAKEASSVSISGFRFPVYSKWSFPESSEYALISAGSAASGVTNRIALGLDIQLYQIFARHCCHFNSLRFHQLLLAGYICRPACNVSLQNLNCLVAHILVVNLAPFISTL